MSWLQLSSGEELFHNNQQLLQLELFNSQWHESKLLYSFRKYIQKQKQTLCFNSQFLHVYLKTE
jgi:hypothetical protein